MAIDFALARRIDHTCLRPEATRTDIDEAISEALRLQARSVCINPVFVKYAARKLVGQPTFVGTVVGFPLGATVSSVKAVETATAIDDGAEEVDMVLAIGALRSGRFAEVEADIRDVVDAAAGKVVKVILETGLLTGEMMVAAVECIKNGGAQFAKTSTGFGPRGATIEDVKLLRERAGAALRVKASGGIRTREQALALIAAGADVLGASASTNLVTV